MKKSHRNLLIFQFGVFLIFVLNSFVSNILRGYSLVLFLVLSLVCFKFLFGFEKTRNRYSKQILTDTFIFVLMFFIMFYLFGIIIGFAKTNYYSWHSLKTFVFPLICTIILKEILRYMIVKKSEGSKILQITTVVIFVFLDITQYLYYNELNTGYNIFEFIALSLLPSVSLNISCNYITKNAGYKPVIFYQLVMNLYQFLLPIIPDLDKYLTSVVFLLLPLIYMSKVYTFMKKEKDEQLRREYNKKSFKGVAVLIAITIVMVYFTCGYFHYFALAIASGSMSPGIKKGDVVIVEKIDGKYEELKKGDILVYKYDNIVVVHRIVNIIKQQNQYYFYTKGDANANIDNYTITEEMVIGTTDLKIPYIGIPTVWLSEL